MSKEFGVNINDERLRDIASTMVCSVGEGPIPYLGMKVGGRLIVGDGCNEVIEKVGKKLMGWDAKAISLGGRVTLVQSTLYVIPLYLLSFCPLPKMVEEKLSSRFK